MCCVNTGIPPFGTEVLLVAKLPIHFTKTEEKILSFTLNNDIVVNCLINFEFFSFGVKQPSPVYQTLGITPFLHSIHIRFQRRINNLGQFLNETPLGPGTDPAFVFFSTKSISYFQVGFFFVK